MPSGVDARAPSALDRAPSTRFDATGACVAAIHGHGGMPARGGMAEPTDAEMKSAVIYLFRGPEPKGHVLSEQSGFTPRFLLPYATARRIAAA